MSGSAPIVRSASRYSLEPRTVCDIFYHSVRRYRKPDHLRYKQDGAWRDISSEEFRRAVEELSMGLRELGVERGDRVAILSENRPEWAIADLATLCAAAADVPIYPNLMPAQVLYILNDSQAKAVFVSTAAQARKIAEIRGQAPYLKHVIRMDEAAIPGPSPFHERCAPRGRRGAGRDARRRRARGPPR